MSDVVSDAVVLVSVDVGRICRVRCAVRAVVLL